MIALRLLFIFFTGPIFCAEPIQSAQYVEEVTVSPQIDTYGTVAGGPIKGTVLVTHDERLKVDKSSFQIKGETFKVEYLKEEKMSRQSPLVISIFRFELKPKKAGDYTLPEVSVKVGGKIYRSQPIPYQVSESSFDLS